MLGKGEAGEKSYKKEKQKGVKKVKREKSFHSICRWTFNPGKGGFVPSNIRPAWGYERLDTVGVVKLIKERILPRLPENIEVGLELHYNNEVNEENASEIANALSDAGIYLAMVTPGAHLHWAYGGIVSLDAEERRKAEEFSSRTVDVIYGPLRKAWHPAPEKAPSLVLWNGSWGYDIASPGIKKMYENLKESIGKLCKYEEERGGKLYISIEPKANEGHPAMLIPTVSSALLLWRKIEEEFGICREKKGVNKEFGHSEMIGLDHIYDTVEELEEKALVHMHVNSQGYNDGIVLGGPGKFDIDYGVRINGMNITIARLIQDAGYERWKGHDMQTRPYDNVEQGIERVVRSILSWEACENSARELDIEELMKWLERRETAKVEDMLREAVERAGKVFNELKERGER